MSARTSRRSFLRTSALAAGAVAALNWMPTRGILHAAAAGDKLRMAVVGCGGQGGGVHVPACARENLVAIVDPDPGRVAGMFGNMKKKKVELDDSKIKIFDDYRKMFDTIGKEIDGISVATPNHHHALPALIAMQLGKGAYVEKPLCYDLAEAKRLAEFSVKYKVATQMGNQGHSGEGYRKLCEYIWAGAIGNVTEVYCWSNRANGGVGPRPPEIDPPKGMNWDNWIGPAPFRKYHKDLHPHEWHGWHDFGNGSLGNMGCHVMDGVHWALKLGSPTAFEAEEMVGGNDERYPLGCRLRWDFPAREAMPAVKVWWFDGKKRGAPKEGKKEEGDDTVTAGRNLPPILEQMTRKYPAMKFDSSGTIYVGDKGMMYTGTYGGGISFLPAEMKNQVPVPPVVIPRVKGGHHGNFFAGIRGEGKPCSNFEVASKLMEVILTGNLAQKAGAGKKLEWDGKQVTNVPAMNKFLAREYRQGWGV